MKVRITRLDKSLPLPDYHTEGAVAFDLYSRMDSEIPSKTLRVLPSNLIIDVPRGFFLLIAARSSLSKKGLVLRNSIGVIDNDFHGPADEIGIMVYNFTEELVSVKRGERLAQGILVPIEKAEWEEVAALKPDSRGGFGSTGH